MPESMRKSVAFLHFSSLFLFLCVGSLRKCESCARQTRECCQTPKYPIDKYIEQLGDLPTISSRYVTSRANGHASLSCSFDDGEHCAWGNLPSNRLRWKRVRFKEPSPTRAQIKSVTSKPELPDGTFAVVGSEAASDEGDATSVLVATIPCQRGPGKLRFNHWTNSASNELHVCVAPTRSSGDKNCVATVRRTSPNPIQFTIPAPDDHGSFQIRLEGSGFRAPGFIMIDDISYDADMCNREGRKPTSGHIQLPVHQEGSCIDFLSCTFEEGTSCFYDVKASRNGQWNVGSGRTGNRLAGPQVDGSGNPQGYYAFVGHDYPGSDGSHGSRQTVYILQSPEIRIKRQVRLVYDIFMRSAGPVLKVCVNDFSTCPKTYTLKNMQMSNDGWTRRESITLKPSAKRLLFTVKGLLPNQYVALDNLSVEGGQGAC